MSILVWSQNALTTVAASGNVDVTVEGNPDVTSFTLVKVSGGNLTAVTVQRSLDNGTTWGAPRAVASGLPLATAGDALDVDFVDELVTAVRFQCTVSASMVLRIQGRAERR